MGEKPAPKDGEEGPAAPSGAEAHGSGDEAPPVLASAFITCGGGEGEGEGESEDEGEGKGGGLGVYG